MAACNDRIFVGPANGVALTRGREAPVGFNAMLGSTHAAIAAKSPGVESDNPREIRE